MGETKHILKRSEQKKENMWSTEDIFASDEAWKAEFAAIKGEEQALAVYAGRLSESPEVLLEYLRKSEELGLRIEDLYNYTFLKNDEDTKNTVYQGLKGQMTGYLVQFQQATAFETPEIIAIPEETLQKFYEECPELRLYERYMYRVRRRKRAHPLPGRGEHPCSRRRNGGDAHADVRQLRECRPDLPQRKGCHRRSLSAHEQHVYRPDGISQGGSAPRGV